MSYARDFSQTELSIVNVTVPQIKGVSDRSGFWLGYFGSIFEESVTKEKQTNQVKNNIDIDSLKVWKVSLQRFINSNRLRSFLIIKI
jgi:hypothetical protein